MPLSSGIKLGAYEIETQIGSGGMGEVYRARDSRLNRVVALKLLPDFFASDPDRLRRFELEAQTAGGLNHSNILVVHDVGVDGGRPYMVSELLEGESLRERLRPGKLPLQKAIDYARQAATGLAAAHARGIVHRDIKPENLFLTSDGRLKILDFGLAKVTTKGGREESATQTVATEPGKVMGTVGYMAPEQVRGKDIDHRADIFSLGCVLFEMVTGTRAFGGESAADTMSAILTKDPMETLPPGITVPASLERTIRHCLEKSVEERFQSARDLAFDLESLRGTATSAMSSPALPPAARTGTRLRWVLAAVLCAMIGAAAFFAGRSAGTRAPDTRFVRLTFRRGVIQGARFVPSNRMVVYAAAWDGGPIELFSTIPGGQESRPLGTPPGGILSIGANSDLLISLGAKFSSSFQVSGTVAQVPLLGGVPREIQEDILFADYSPVTREMAVVPAFKRNEGARLEYPPGKALWKAKGTAWPSHIRISPKGDLVAFADHYYLGDDGSVAVVDRSGTERVLTDRFTSLQGIAWSPSGDEIWFTGGKQGTGRALYAVTLAGKQRLVSGAPGNMTLHDIAADGRVLLSRDEFRTSIDFAGSEDAAPRDLAWMDWSSLQFLSDDGKTILILESGEGSRGVSSLFIRKTDGASAVHIGDGNSGPLSPDGRWVVSRVDDDSDLPDVRLVPARAGVQRILDRSGLVRIGNFAWMPDSKRIVFNGAEKDRPPRSFIQSIDGGPPRPITPEGETGVLVLHDGSALLTTHEERYYLHPLNGGESRLLPWKPEPGLVPIQSTLDGRWVYLQKREGLVSTIFRTELNTGRREVWKVIKPSNPVDIRDIGRVFLTPDGKTYALRVVRDSGDLYLAEGLH